MHTFGWHVKLQVGCGRTAALTLCHKLAIAVPIFCTISTSEKNRVIKINSNDPHLLENLPTLKHHRKLIFGLTD